MSSTPTTLSSYSFSMPPEEHKPFGCVNMDRIYTFDVITTMYDPETNAQTRTNHGTIKLTPEEYTYMLTTDPRTDEQYVSE